MLDARLRARVLDTMLLAEDPGVALAVHGVEDVLRPRLHVAGHGAVDGVAGAYGSTREARHVEATSIATAHFGRTQRHADCRLVGQFCARGGAEHGRQVARDGWLINDVHVADADR